MRDAMTVQARLEEGFGVPHPIYASGVSDTLGRLTGTQSFEVRPSRRAGHSPIYIGPDRKGGGLMPRAVNDTRDLETVGSGSVAVWLDFAGRYREGVAVRTPDGWRLTGAGFPSFPLVEDGRLTVARLTVADRWPSEFTTVELMDGTVVHLERERATGMMAGRTLDGLTVTVPLTAVRLSR